MIVLSVFPLLARLIVENKELAKDVGNFSVNNIKRIKAYIEEKGDIAESIV